MDQNFNLPKNEKVIPELSEQGKDVFFSVKKSPKEDIASLHCEINEEKGVFIARTITVDKDVGRQGIGSSLFVNAIEYAKKHGLGFVTDYGISGDAEKLILSLAGKGYTFTKNPNAVERELGLGKRIVTFDGSPVYVLNN